MRQIVIAAQNDHENTEALVRWIKILFPECEVQVTPSERGLPGTEEHE